MAVYSIEDVERVFGVTYTPEERAKLENIPFSKEVLEECANTHILFPGYPLSLLVVREKFSDLFCTKNEGWYAAEIEEFSRVPLAVRWHLLRMEPVPGSYNKNWEEQCKLLTAVEDVPTTVTMTFAMILHFKQRDERLFERTYVRVSDNDADGDRVGVGIFDADGLRVCYDGGGYRFDGFGLSSARRS